MLKKQLCALALGVALNAQPVAAENLLKSGSLCMREYADAVLHNSQFRHTYFPFKWTATAGKIVFVPNHSNNGSAGIQLAMWPFAAASLLGFVELADVGRTAAIPFIKLHEAYQTHAYAETFRLLTLLQLFVEEIEGRVQFNDNESVIKYLQDHGQGSLYAYATVEQVNNFLSDTAALERSLVFQKLIVSPDYLALKTAANVTVSDTEFVAQLLREYVTGEHTVFCGDKRSGSHFRLKEIAHRLTATTR